MIQRCTNKNTPTYKYYGGRGITVCDKWKKHTGFYEDMYEQYILAAEKHGVGRRSFCIDRINNDKGYYKDNCIFVKTEHSLAKRRPRVIDKDSVYQKVKALGMYGVRYDGVKYRMKKGMSYELAVADICKKL